MKRLIFTGIALSVLFASSCQSSKASLQRAAATSIGNTLSNEVVVTKVKRKATSVSWRARKGDICYSCEADDLLKSTNCVQVKCEN